jgi:hypothetical protein
MPREEWNVSTMHGDRGVQAAGNADAGDLRRQDPLLRLMGTIRRKPWRSGCYGLAALALLGGGVAAGMAVAPSPGTPSVKQGVVTWVNEGLPRSDGSGGPPQFLVRFDWARRPQVFDLLGSALWTTAGNAGWTEGGIPSCMIPVVHGRPARAGFGHVRARIRFGALHVRLPDGQLDDVAVWVECLS